MKTLPTLQACPPLPPPHKVSYRINQFAHPTYSSERALFSSALMSSFGPVTQFSQSLRTISKSKAWWLNRHNSTGRIFIKVYYKNQMRKLRLDIDGSQRIDIVSSLTFTIYAWSLLPLRIVVETSVGYWAFLLDQWFTSQLTGKNFWPVNLGKM